MPCSSWEQWWPGARMRPRGKMGFSLRTTPSTGLSLSPALDDGSTRLLLDTYYKHDLTWTFQLPEVKNFIYGDFESKFERTVFKKIPGKAPELIFFTQAGKEVERLNIEKFSR